jgi:hypothetical protein
MQNILEVLDAPGHKGKGVEGGETWPRTEESAVSTMEWMMDWGWMTMSMSS